MTKTRVENARLKRLNIMSNWYQKIIFFRSEMPGLVLEGNFHFCEQEYIECSPQEFSLREIQLLRNNCFAEVSFYMLIWAINSHLIPWWWFSKGAWWTCTVWALPPLERHIRIFWVVLPFLQSKWSYCIVAYREKLWQSPVPCFNLIPVISSNPVDKSRFELPLALKSANPSLSRCKPSPWKCLVSKLIPLACFLPPGHFIIRQVESRGEISTFLQFWWHACLDQTVITLVVRSADCFLKYI